MLPIKIIHCFLWGPWIQALLVPIFSLPARLTMWSLLLCVWGGYCCPRLCETPNKSISNTTVILKDSLCVQTEEKHKVESKFDMNPFRWHKLWWRCVCTSLKRAKCVLVLRRKKGWEEEQREKVEGKNCSSSYTSCKNIKSSSAFGTTQCGVNWQGAWLANQRLFLLD